MHSFIGDALQERLCKLPLSSIRVGVPDLQPKCDIETPLFLHQDHPVVARMPALRSLTCESIPDSLQLRQIGTFIGLNPHMEKVALGLQAHFVEELVPHGPEGLGVMIRAIVKAHWASPPILLNPPRWPHQFSLRELTLSTFAMDEDAEKGLCFLICHCPLETLVLQKVAIYGDLSTFFRSWRRPEALSYLQRLIFETNTLDEHAIDFPALADFLTYLGSIPHNLHSLELLGGWRLLNMEDAALKALKASTILDGLKSLVWESCVSRWCDDCASARVTRREMSIFADIASCCHNIVVLGLPGLFISDHLLVDSLTGNHNLPLLHGIPPLRRLRHLHIQHTDRLNPEWLRWAVATLAAPKASMRETREDSEYYVETSPKLRDNDFDDGLFRHVARAIAIISLESTDTPWRLESRSFDTFSISFGVLKCLVRVWRTRVKKGLHPRPGCGIAHGIRTSKASLHDPMFQRCYSLASTRGVQEQLF